MQSIEKIGFGGGCHWCTEAVFKSLQGVEKVEQGYIPLLVMPTPYPKQLLFILITPKFLWQHLLTYI